MTLLPYSISGVPSKVYERSSEQCNDELLTDTFLYPTELNASVGSQNAVGY